MEGELAGVREELGKVKKEWDGERMKWKGERGELGGAVKGLEAECKKERDVVEELTKYTGTLEKRLSGGEATSCLMSLHNIR